MVKFLSIAYASASLMALATPAYAQQGSTEGASDASTDIIVTARRRDESVQDVPLVVNAVTSQALEKLNIRDMKDITSVVPGLQLVPNANGIGSVATLRGINFDVNSSGNNGTVEFYLNDAPVSSNVVLQSMYDVGQIEVLRGPQGTLRGRASPSGSITITTRKPGLTKRMAMSAELPPISVPSTCRAASTFRWSRMFSPCALPACSTTTRSTASTASMPQVSSPSRTPGRNG